ncbi:MAG: hypothetical protein AAGJ18_30070 [Bacteroidota bacterium]
MTLQEFFDLLAVNPTYIVGFFVLIPIAALIGSVIGKGEAHEPVWKYYYSTLIYLAAVPGIFAITLNVYLFLFQRQNIMQADVLTQILPILSMIATLIIVRKAVDLDKLPGFDNLSGLIWIISAVLLLMWMLEKTRIYVFTYMPVQYVVLILFGLILVIRFGWSKLSRS